MTTNAAEPCTYKAVSKGVSCWRAGLLGSWSVPSRSCLSVESPLQHHPPPPLRPRPAQLAEAPPKKPGSPCAAPSFRQRHQHAGKQEGTAGRRRLPPCLVASPPPERLTSRQTRPRSTATPRRHRAAARPGRRPACRPPSPRGRPLMSPPPPRGSPPAPAPPPRRRDRERARPAATRSTARRLRPPPASGSGDPAASRRPLPLRLPPPPPPLPHWPRGRTTPRASRAQRR